MPNYAFICEECNYAFDRVMPLSQSSELTECPKCGSMEHVRKSYRTPVPVKFVGEGFSKDYRG